MAESASGSTDKNPMRRLGYCATCAAVNLFSRLVISARSPDFTCNDGKPKRYAQDKITPFETCASSSACTASAAKTAGGLLDGRHSPTSQHSSGDARCM